MNSLYEKLGKKKYDKSIYGDAETIKQQMRDKETAIINVDFLIKPAPNEEPLYKMTYHTNHYKKEEIGSLCRFSSYITALSRTRLIEAAYKIGIDNVGYTFHCSNV